MRVLIIGNGPSVLEKEFGDTIDSYDTVIRINDYTLDGYTKCLGNKINIWAMDTKVFSWHDKWPDRYKMIPEIWILPSAAYHGGSAVLAQEIRKIHNNFYIGTLAHALKLRIQVGTFPSTGINTISVALKKFSDHPLDIIGFDHFSSPKIDYWDEGVKTVAPHGVKQERAFVQRLIDKNKLRRLS